MIEFLLGLIAGLLLPKWMGKWCCGCFVLLFGGVFALLAIIFALAAGDQHAVTRLIVGIAGVAVGWFTFFILKKLAT